MARKKKSSPADDLIGLVSMMPWWAGVALAAISYFVLHQMATAAFRPAEARRHGCAPQDDVQKARPTGCSTSSPSFAWLAPPSQHGSAASAKGCSKASWRSKSADVLDGMTWHQFERLVGEAFRLQGYTVTETGGGGADGGVDLALTRGGEKFLVQCKQWRAFKVGSMWCASCMA